MTKKSNNKATFDLVLKHTEHDDVYEVALVNNTDKKYRIVDVMRGAIWYFNGEQYYAKEDIKLLAPVIEKVSIPLAYFNSEDLKSVIIYFIDVYDGDRTVEPVRYISVMNRMQEHIIADDAQQVMIAPFEERENYLTIHDKVKARPSITPQIRKILSKRLDKAVQIVALAHAEQKRKGGDIPYIVHPFRVMHIASQVTNDEDILIACLLHDVLEDVPDKYSREQMMEDFGARVVGFVDDVTKDDSIKDWRKRSEAYLEHLKEAEEESVIVSACDKINNLNAVLADYEEVGETLWKRFNAGKKEQLWWYESVYKIIRTRLPDSPLREAMGRQMKQLRKIVNN